MRSVLHLTSALAIVHAKHPSSPHIVMLLADDLGWHNVGWHKSDPNDEVKTPTMDKLVADGVELDRFYVFKYCSPTRSALQSGRNPIHVNVCEGECDMVNPKDPIAGYFGIPLNMTGIAAKLATAGYATHAVGKWDVGVATPEHTPIGRGYETWLGYFGHANDYWRETASGAFPKCGNATTYDLWWQNRSDSKPSRPATDLINPTHCSQDSQNGCLFEDELFKQHAIGIIEDHPLDGTPLFLFWATHAVHGPLQVPEATYDKFSNIDLKQRRLYTSLVNYLDDMVSDVVTTLQKKGMWNDTLFFMSSDNGGDKAGNNYPLRGGKFSSWEGGIRVPAFVSGGALAPTVRGTKSSGLATIWDFYATFCDIAGVDPSDRTAEAAGLPGTDNSVSQWSYWSGSTDVAPRSEVALGSAMGDTYYHMLGPTTVEGLIQGEYKLLLGLFHEAVWTGPQSPNHTAVNWGTSVDCSSGCLFNIVADPSECQDLASSKPHIVKKMLARIQEINATVFSPERGDSDPQGCDAAVKNYDGFWGPWLNVDDYTPALV